MDHHAGPLPPRLPLSIIAGALLLAAPLAASVLLEQRPSLDVVVGSPTTHFYVVSVVAALSLVFAVAVLWAARRLPDPRTFFLAMGFISMATIFVAHGLGTSPLFHQHTAATTTESATDSDFATYTAPVSVPSVYGGSPPAGITEPVDSVTHVVDPTTIARGIVVGYSAQLSLFVSGVFFALSVLSFGPRTSRFVLRHKTWLTVALTTVLAGHVWVALFEPTMLSWIPIGSDRARYLIGGAAILCFLFAGWRFYQAWRLALLPLQAAMAIGMGFLIEAQIFMVRGQLWHLSWWEYHLVMLMGFGLCVVALLRQYRLTGDLGAVVEGLFLRQQVDGIRHGDPQALVALTAAVAAKDTETAEHIGRVGDLVVAIGEHLGLPADRIEVLRFAGRLHDVGKIGVPNSILRKPGKLTPGEFAVIKLHSPRGGTIAVRSEMLAEAAPIIRAHHERLDGAGYPDGLKGDEIPLEARIVAVADVWDALTCDRPYRAAMTTGEAMAILDRDAGRHLDPVCIAALYAVLGIARRATRGRPDPAPSLPSLSALHWSHDLVCVASAGSVRAARTHGCRHAGAPDELSRPPLQGPRHARQTRVRAVAAARPPRPARRRRRCSPSSSPTSRCRSISSRTSSRSLARWTMPPSCSSASCSCSSLSRGNDSRQPSMRLSGSRNSAARRAPGLSISRPPASIPANLSELPLRRVQHARFQVEVERRVRQRRR